MNPVVAIERVEGVELNRRIKNENIGLATRVWFNTVDESEKNNIYKLVFHPNYFKETILRQSSFSFGCDSKPVVSAKKAKKNLGMQSVLEDRVFEISRFAIFGLIEEVVDNSCLFDGSLSNVSDREIRIWLENIRSVVVDVYKNIPLAITDDSFRSMNMNRLLGCLDECFNCYLIAREKLRDECQESSHKMMSDRSECRADNRLYGINTLKSNDVVFAFCVYWVGKVIEVFLSDNFSSVCMDSMKQKVIEMRSDLVGIFKSSMNSEDKFVQDRQFEIDSMRIDQRERDCEQRDLDEYVSKRDKVISEFEKKITAGNLCVDILSERIENLSTCVFVNDRAFYIDG